MNSEDVIRMAQQTGWDFGWEMTVEHVCEFAALVAAAEREACAKVAEERLLDKANCTAEQMYEMLKKSIAEAIRARGQS
jgi:hypothetical protein